MVTLLPDTVMPVRPSPDKSTTAEGRARQATRTEEVAVMLDTRRPLKACAAADGVELNDYWRSWK